VTSRRLGRFALAALLAAAACAPAPAGPDGLAPPDRGADVAGLTPLERTAWTAWHLMELHRLRTGRYSTEALQELELARGVRWTVTELGDDAYALAISRDDDAARLRVSPAGVAARP
jgi:hypothetical protein